jgi:hypothetical protein
MTGAITKATFRQLAGTITLVGSIVKATSRLLTGSTTATGDAATAYTTTQSTAGSTTPSGTVAGVKVILTSAVAAVRRTYFTFFRRRR